MSLASTPNVAHTATGNPEKSEVGLIRLYVLRATYLLLIVGLGATDLPVLMGHDPTSRGVIPSVLGGLWFLALIGLRYPLRMLPLLLFEFSWKTIWLLAFGLPQWSAGQMPPTWHEDFKAIAMGVILMPIVIPWSYVYRHYIKQPSERWSRSAGAGAVSHAGSEVSLTRLYVMRAYYLFLVVAGALIVPRLLFGHEPMARGVFASMLVALWVLSFFVIRYPLQMVPMLLLEFVWKSAWLISFGLPQWMAGMATPQLREDLLGIGMGPILFAIVIPWSYVWRHYVTAPGDRWR